MDITVRKINNYSELTINSSQVPVISNFLDKKESIEMAQLFIDTASELLEIAVPDESEKIAKLNRICNSL